MTDIRNPALSDARAVALREISSIFLHVVRPFSEAMARHIHEQEPDLGSLDNHEALEATRKSAEGNMREIFSMLRAGLPATAHHTPVEALEHLRYFRSVGVGFQPIIHAYQYGVAMFRDALGPELAAHARDETELVALAEAADEFLFAYIHAVMRRLAAEFKMSGGWAPATDDTVLANAASADAARRFREEQISRRQWLPASSSESSARFEAERSLERFATIFRRASGDPYVSAQFCRAATSVAFTLADEPDLSVTIMLDDNAVIVLDGLHPAETQISIASVDLDRLWSRDLNLPMLFVFGRAHYSGPIRKFLQLCPILRVRAAREREADGLLTSPR
jgi:hypothetical protein